MCKHIFTDCRHTKVNMRARKAIKITAIVLLVTLIFIILGGIFAIITLTNVTNLKNNDLNSITANLRVVSASGEEIEYYSRYKAEVSYQEISPYIVNAFVALEDKRFYKHHGLDYKRIAGAAVNNIKAGYLKEGGSTITQQLAKNAILSNEKSFVRKLKEAKLAIQIEKRYSKDEIMTMYLNTIYFGHSLYGVKAACARLFGKTPSEVNVAEAAMLAGIVKNPLKNSPLNSVENATERRNLVLKLMLEQGYIDESEYESALRAEYTAPPEQKSDTASGSYANAAIYEAATILGSSVKEVITGGYTVITYCDTQAQELLKRAYDAESISVDGADKMFLLGDNSTSGVCAYVSGISYAPHEFRRQPASTIKPIMAYAPAFDTGIYSPSSPIEDKLYDFNGYSPQNYQNSYLGWTTVRNAILTSSNACALKTVADLGLDRSMSYAKKFGINFDDKDGAASVLGGMTYGVTSLEIAEAYMTLASGGMHRDLKFVSEIIDKNGKKVFIRSDPSERVLSAAAAYLTTDILTECASEGTASKLRTLGYPVAAKTGTNGDESGNTDAWNMSYTSRYTLCAWYGALDGKMPSSVTGGSYPTLAARYIYGGLPRPTAFEEPESVIYADIDTYCAENSHILRLASVNTPEEYRRKEMFSYDNLPEVSDYFDNALPEDFEVTLGDGEIVIGLTASERFDYRVFDLNGTEILNISAGRGHTETVIPQPVAFGLEGYYVEAVTEDGVCVAESAPIIVFISGRDPFFDLFDKFPH